MCDPTGIDTSAPVVARHSVDIAAPLETVLGLHTDVNRWPERQTDITATHSGGTFLPGAAFTWTSYGFTVTSTIFEVKARSRVLWGGTADGITGVHEWIFHETPTGARVETNESFAGDPVKADASAMQAMLDGSLSSWLGHLKAAAESAA
jgi:hypothetical protein